VYIVKHSMDDSYLANAAGLEWHPIQVTNDRSIPNHDRCASDHERRNPWHALRDCKGREP